MYSKGVTRDHAGRSRCQARRQGRGRTANDLAHASVPGVDAMAAFRRTRRFAVLGRLGARGLAGRARSRRPLARRQRVPRRSGLDLGADGGADRSVAAGLVPASVTPLHVVLAAMTALTRLVRPDPTRRRPRRADSLHAPMEPLVGLGCQTDRIKADAPRQGRRCRWTAGCRSCASTS